MPHSLADERTRSALHKKLIDALEKSRACGNFLYTWEDQFDAFEAEALKSVGSWMNEEDLTSLVMSAFSNATPSDVSTTDEIYFVKEAIPASLVHGIADVVLRFLTRIPIAYEIQFQLPGFPAVTDEIVLSDRVKLIPRFPVGIGMGTEGATISIQGSGFAKTSLQNSAARDAMSILKVVLRLGVLRRIFRHKAGPTRHVPSILPLPYQTDVSHFASIQEHGNNLALHFRLGAGLSAHLEGLSWVDRGTGTLLDSMRELGNSIDMMYHPEAENNVRTIRRAMEWQFDAIIDEDATTQFVKHCIGLEALLAEQSEDMGITEKLADRCAFLLSNTPEERARRRVMVREVYRLRSKIVHGSVSGLSHKDVVTSHHASNLLNSLLSVELDSVSRWWGRRLHRAPQT